MRLFHSNTNSPILTFFCLNISRNKLLPEKALHSTGRKLELLGNFHFVAATSRHLAALQLQGEQLPTGPAAARPPTSCSQPEVVLARIPWQMQDSSDALIAKNKALLGL